MIYQEDNSVYHSLVLEDAIEYRKDKDPRQFCLWVQVIHDYCNKCPLCFSILPEQETMSGCYLEGIHLTR